MCCLPVKLQATFFFSGSKFKIKTFFQHFGRLFFNTFVAATPMFLSLFYFYFFIFFWHLVTGQLRNERGTRERKVLQVGLEPATSVSRTQPLYMGAGSTTSHPGTQFLSLFLMSVLILFQHLFTFLELFLTFLSLFSTSFYQFISLYKIE